MNEFFSEHKLHEATDPTTIVGENPHVPDDVITLLEQVGTSSYASGFFRFIIADDFRHYFSMWDLNPLDCFPFLKGAFGQLIFFHVGQFKLLNPVYNCIDVLGKQDELAFVMDVLLCDRPALESSFFIDMYEQTVAELGVPDVDEMYAFIPALRLGGSRDALHVRKVKMLEQMTILSQV